MKGLKGKNVLVTGASSGIGQAIAVRFAEEGANVAVNYRTGIEQAHVTEERMKGVCAQIAGCEVKHVLIRADMAIESDIISMIETTVRELGSLDVLVNNAGIQISAASHEMKTEDFDRVVSVDLRGPYLCAREAVRHFLARKGPGVILNISSVHEIIPKPHYIGYSVSKGGMANLTKSLALEYAGQGIRVNAIAPGATITPMNRAWVDDPKAREAVEKHIPLARAATAEEVAAVVVFMASDEASYITGQTLYVDGGLTLYPGFRTPWSSGE